MRLSSEQVKQGIRHPDAAVRDAAVRYFSQAFSQDPTIMPVVIQAIEQYGWQHAVSPLAFGEGLVQTEETVVWLITESRRVGRPEDQDWCHYQAGLRHLLAAADAQLLRKYEAELSHVGLTDTDFRAAIHDRIRLLTVNADTCWRELESFAERVKDKEYLSDVNLAPAHYLIEAIARDGTPYVARVLEVLQQELPEDPHHFLNCFVPLVVRLAGQLRLDCAVPSITDKLHEEHDWLNEECQRALIKIGTDDVVAAIVEAFPVAPWQFRLYAAGVLAGIHSDRCVTSSLVLLREENDGDIAIELGRALLSHFAYDAVTPMRRMILARRNEAEILTLQEELITACTLMGVDFPEFLEWKDEVVDTAQWRRRALREQWATTEENIKPRE